MTVTTHQLGAGARCGMTPVQTRQRRNRRTGRMEVWSAESTDGVWTYERTEEPGTPWQVHHIPTGRTYLDRSLPRARTATADGTALAYLDQLDAENARHREQVPA